MRFALIAAATAAVLCGLPGNADAQTTQRMVRGGDRTIIVNRDETGRTRTRIVVQKRSYLDPGTQVFPGEVRYNDSIQAVMQRPTEPLRGQAGDWDRQFLPRYDLPLPPQ